MSALNSLLALACGDAYGNHYESEGLGGKRWPIDLLPDVPVIREITDDTKMALILWNHYEMYGTDETERSFAAYKRWAWVDGYKDGIGIHTADVLLHGKQDKGSQGNGALMRVIPYGLRLIEDGCSFEVAVDHMNTDSAMTHDDETVFIANRLCLDIALHGLDRIRNKKEYRALIENCPAGHTAWVKHTLHTVIQALEEERTFLDGFKFIVSQGGDTDTNCAIYGAIKGYRSNISDEITIGDFLTNKILKQYPLKQ